MFQLFLRQSFRKPHLDPNFIAMDQTMETGLLNQWIWGTRHLAQTRHACKRQVDVTSRAWLLVQLKIVVPHFKATICHYDHLQSVYLTIFIIIIYIYILIVLKILQNSISNWWYTYPPEKIWKSDWTIIPNIGENHPNVPNHQPDIHLS
jgi:hypothetical protein